MGLPENPVKSKVCRCNVKMTTKAGVNVKAKKVYEGVGQFFVFDKGENIMIEI